MVVAAGDGGALLKKAYADAVNQIKRRVDDLMFILKCSYIMIWKSMSGAPSYSSRRASVFFRSFVRDV
jgi:hypothetical protein